MHWPFGTKIFKDRIDAGRRLAERLESYGGRDTIVLALPRGGVPVGYEVAKALGAPLDVFISRKLGAPMQPELGIGAIAPGGVLVLDEATIQALGIPPEEIARIVERESAELERRLRRFRGDRPMPQLEGKTVILVDDGLATGVTASAAIKAVRQLRPSEVVLAAPVCAAHTADVLRSLADGVVCVETPQNFGAVGLWYRNFEQTSDEEVTQLLERARSEQQGGGSNPTYEQIAAKREAGYALLEHTADAGLVAWGRTPVEAFAQATYGMFAIILGREMPECADLPEQSTLDVQVRGAGWDDLLVNWLAEVLFYYDTEGLVPVRVEIAQCAPPHCAGMLHCGVPHDDAVAGGVGVKAITYHQLKVDVREDKTELQVIFDI